jgi:Lon protease-like protein
MGRCVSVVEQVIAELVETESNTMKRVLEPPYLLQSASWVSHRLCEILPFGSSSKQLMLELSDPLQRLSIVNQVLQKHSAALNER